MTEQRKKILERGSYFPGGLGAPAVQPRHLDGDGGRAGDLRRPQEHHPRRALRDVRRPGRGAAAGGGGGQVGTVHQAGEGMGAGGPPGPLQFLARGRPPAHDLQRRKKQLLRGQRRRLQLGTAGPEPEGVQRVHREQHPRDPGARPHSRRPRRPPGRAVQDHQRRRILARPRHRRGGRRHDEADRCWRAEHYEGEAYSGRKVVLKGAMEGHVSPDRFNWTKIEEPVGNYSVNGGLALFYDAHNRTYFSYIQPQGCAPVEPQSLGTGMPETEVVRRAVGLTRTKDFRRWPAAKLLVHPDAQDPFDISFYGACYFPYPGRQELHGMFLPVFHGVTDHVDMQIAFSRDGLVWSRPERRPIAPLGPPGSGDEGQIHVWRQGLVELPDGSWAVPYEGRSTLHTVLEEHQAEVFGQLESIREPLGALAAPSSVRRGGRIGRALHHSHRVPAGEGAAPELPLRPGRLDQRRAAAPGSHDAVPGCQPAERLLLRGVRPSHRGRGRTGSSPGGETATSQRSARWRPSASGCFRRSCSPTGCRCQEASRLWRSQRKLCIERVPEMLTKYWCFTGTFERRRQCLKCLKNFDPGFRMWAGTSRKRSFSYWGRVRIRGEATSRGV